MFATLFSRIPDLRARLDLSNGALGLLLLSVSVGSLVGLPVSGRLIERFGARLTLNPPPPTPITAPRDTAFDVLLSGYQLVDRVLRADREATEGRAEYDDVYYQRFFDKVRPILEERLSMAISATAGLITGAWVQAGRPVVRLDEARPVQRIERSR